MPISDVNFFFLGGGGEDWTERNHNRPNGILARVEKYTPSRNAVPLLLQSSASILVAIKASSMLAPEAITAQTMAPAEEPANGVVSCISTYIPAMKNERLRPKIRLIHLLKEW